MVGKPLLFYQGVFFFVYFTPRCKLFFYPRLSRGLSLIRSKTLKPLENQGVSKCVPHRGVMMELADGLWNPALARSLLCADLAPSCLPKHGISAARKCGRLCLVSYPHENRPAHLRCTGLFWSWQTDLNPRPADYKSAALPTELCQRIKRAAQRRRQILHTASHAKKEKHAGTAKTAVPLRVDQLYQRIGRSSSLSLQIERFTAQRQSHAIRRRAWDLCPPAAPNQHTAAERRRSAAVALRTL